MSTTQTAMERLWDKLPKNKDGYTVTYAPGDLPYLYSRGFVDSQRFTLEQWKQAFAPYKAKDGNFILTREQFLKLDVYRFKQIVGDAFEPLKLREGAWPDHELAYLWQSTIKTSSTITFEIFEKSIEIYKKKGKVNKLGHLLVDLEVKQQLQYLLERFPSPKRILEKEVAKIREKRGEKIAGASKDRDASVFTVGQSKQEIKHNQFQNLQASKPKAPEDLPPTDGPTVDLKSLKKPIKKFRG